MQNDFLPEQNGAERARKLPAEAWAVAMIVGGVALLAIAISYLPTAIRLDSNQAVPGTYVVEGSVSCNRGGHVCRSHTGSFTSDDGTVVRTGAGLRGIPKAAQPGYRVRAVDVGEPGMVFTSVGDGGWPFTGLIAFGGPGVLLFGFGWWRLWRWWKS